MALAPRGADVTPPDDAPLSLRILALMGVGGGISTAADTVLHHIPAGVLGAPPMVTR